MSRAPNHPHPPSSEEPSDPTQLLDGLRLKVFAGFVGVLMLMYSFFGSIYRVPMQLEQQQKEIAAVFVINEKVNDRIVALERVIATKEDLFAEIVRSRARIEVLERAEASRVSMQQQLDRLETVTRELTKILDNTSARLTELSINVVTLKEAAVETRRAIEELKRK